MARLATEDQVTYLHDLLQKTGEDLDDLLETYGVACLEDLTVWQASECIQELKSSLR